MSIAVDDTSRVGYAQALPDEWGHRVVAFLCDALAHSTALCAISRQVPTDIGHCHCSREFAQACRDFVHKRRSTRLHALHTNGTAVRFIPTALRKCARIRACQLSRQRIGELPRPLQAYNWSQPHPSLASQPAMF